MSCGKQQHIVVDELKPRPGQKENALNQMRSLVAITEKQIVVLSFWVLHRGNNEQDDSLLVFARYDGKDALTQFTNQKAVSGIWEVIASMVEERRTTTWEEFGLGFLARQNHSN